MHHSIDSPSTKSFCIEDIDDDENLPPNASAMETQQLLTTEDQIPRYLTSSPLPSIRLIDEAPKNTWSTLKTRSKYYLPILQWLPLYNRHLFLGDCLAGITLACLLIPQGLSYATALCKLDAIHGLYGIAFPAISYAFFGMSRQMSVGPEATLALLIGSSIAQQEHIQSVDDYQIDPLAWACLMTLFVGLFTLLLGIFRLGFLDSLMSRALLRGFISGVALVVMVQQAITLFGLVELSKEWGISEASTTVERLYFLIKNMNHAHGLSTVVSIISIFILLAMRILKAKHGQSKKWFQLFPDVLVVVVLSILLTQHYNWDHKGLAILGKIESAGIPLPSIPSFPPSKHMKDLLVTSAMISIIGFVESIVIAKIYSSRRNYSVSPNRELVALGVANICSGIFQGIPAFGSVSRSKINDKAGARTQMACLVTGVIAILAILFLLPYFHYLPKAVLSSIIFVAVLSLLSELPEDLHFIFKIGAWRDLGLLLITFFATIIISLEFGTLLAVSLSLLVTIRETSYPRISIMGRVKGSISKFKPIQDDSGEVEHLQDVLIIRIEEALFFANTGQLKDRLRRLEMFGDMSIHPSENPRRSESLYTIFDVGSMPTIDASAIQILYEIVEAYKNRSVEVCFVRLREQPYKMFKKSGLLYLVGQNHLFRKVSEAIEFVELDISKRGNI
ncbi:sulfate transporter family-domain-containing protein [Cokeromyces recurvatus]|uniref:sulfate transporter family-domain-containing protein n=1 Tax=Cokeromyces recurvatus TaxID=90255 RepID=UPI0022204E4D|nr:sulfate transporter family-domain-containing protein [Cokeromyces recurvatus]KAI7905826.1 sulfate transporter family-domain-containing protein [Cokeromyces recurvatus]